MPILRPKFRAMLSGPGGLARSAALVIGLVVPALVAFTLHRQHAQELAGAETRAANTAHAIEQHAERTFENIDTYLRAVASLVGPRADGPSPEALHAALREQIARSGLLNISVIDRDGHAVAEADAFPVRPLDVHDRAYFQAARDRPGGGLVVGRPIVGRLSGKTLIPLARRIDRPDGAFAGIVQAILDPQTFESVYGGIDNGPGAGLTLWHTDGTLLVRSPPLPGVIGRNFADTDNYRRHVLSRDEKPYWTTAVTDGVERVVAYSFLDGYPLYVGAAVARSDALAAWWRSAIVQACVAGGLTLVLVAALLLLAREVERRRDADALIRASEARHRLLADNATDIIVWSGLDTVRRYVSPAVTAVLGYVPEALVGTRPLDFTHPDDAAGYARVLDDLTAGRVERAVTSQRYRHADGRWVWLEISFSLTRDPATGAADGYVATLRDVGERKAAEDALRASEARTRALADALPQLVWIKSAETGEATYVNRRFEEYYGPIGPSRDERLSRNHPDDAERMQRLWREARDRGVPFEAEGRLRRHDGAYRWHKLVMVPIRQDGAVVGTLGTALDIDEIVAARREVEEASSLLLLAQRAADAGTWHLDLASGRIDWSPGSARLHGIETDKDYTLDTAAWLGLIDRGDGERALAVAGAAAEAGEAFTIEFRVPLPDGGVRWISSIGRGVPEPDGRVRRMLGLNLDVTERKAAEAAVLAAGATAEAARAEAERASAAKGEFLAAMSHEIRTPLNGVIGYADLLCEEPNLGVTARQHAERIRTAGAALLTVVNDVLDFSKVEAGRVELAPRPFALETMIDNAVSIVRGTAERKGLALTVERADGLPAWVEGDEDRLRQVLLNLLNNAVKFTDRGGVALAVGPAPAEAGETGCLRFAVRDTGIGVPADKRDRLFRRFSQVDGSISRDYGGTGLGLAISKALVDLMGGAIGVESLPGHGSTFWFEVGLPAVVPVVQADPVAAAAAHVGGKRLLLAEDVPLNQDLARAILERAGHAVDVVGDGAAAVRAVQARSYDLVLMDVQMPGMDGLTATRRIRALDGAVSRVPIVAMTANVLPEQVAEFRAAGMDDHVGKPFRRDMLLATIERWATGATAVAPPSGIDRSVYDEMQATVGGERMSALLAMLADELDQRFGPSSRARGRDQIAMDAHAMVSATRMLGFAALADLCREVETACHSGADAGPLLEVLRRRAAEAVVEIGVLRAA